MALSDPTQIDFNIFSETTPDNIRVGYISTERGYIDGLTVLEANRYAESNPGTQFIFRNRDKILYLNINEVNNLTIGDLTPARSATNGQCKPVVGLREQDILNALGGDVDSILGDNSNNSNINSIIETIDGPIAINTNNSVDNFENYLVRLHIFGGGGVGAKANPIIGKDGSLLACHVVSGGFGYQYPPQVKIIDDKDIGKGATAVSIIGNTIPVLEDFESENDFEDYKTDGVEYGSSPKNWGRRFSPTGKDIGEWDPSTYLKPEKDPIRREIDKYQRFLAELTNPWWDTRKESPLQVTGKDRKDRVIFNVQHPAWGPKEDDPNNSKFFTDVEFEIYGQGSRRNISLKFLFKADDGSHEFSVDGIDDTSRTGGSGKSIFKIVKVKRNTTYSVTTQGRTQFKKIQPDAVINQGLISELGRKSKVRDGGKNNKIFADVVGSAEDNDDIQLSSKKGSFTAKNKRTITGSIPNRKKQTRTTYDLTFRVNERIPFSERKIPNSFMNTYAVSPVPISNAKGSDFAGINYTMEWEENFPYSGEYIFRGTADNEGKLYLDNEYVMDMEGFRSNPKKFPKNVNSGVHRIRLDLFNVPQYEWIKASAEDNSFVPIEFEIYGHGGPAIHQLKFIFSEKNGKHSFTVNNVSKSGGTKKQTIKLKANSDYDVKVITGNDTTSEKKEYPINIEYANAKSFGLEVNDSRKRIKFDDDANDGFDKNAQLKIISSSPGVDAKFSSDGTKLEVKGNGDVTIRYDWDDSASTSGTVLRSLEIAGTTWRQSGTKGEQTETINTKNGSSNNLVAEQGTLKENYFKQGKRGIESGPNQSNTILGDIVGSSNDNDDMQIKVSDGIFTPSNKRSITGVFKNKSKKRGTWDLTYRVERNIKEEVVGSDGNTNKSENVFNTLDFIDKADRKLWRINPKADIGADFANRYGVLPFNPNGEGRTNGKTVSPKPSRSRPRAKIFSRGDKAYLRVFGTGKVSIDFKLNVDDNLTTSGLAVRDVKIESDDGNISLKRDIKNLNLGRGQNRLVGKEKEKIKGSGEFTAGKTYEIKYFGGSSTSGFKTVDNTIIFDDDITNGLDKNAKLKITNIKNIGNKDNSKNNIKSTDDYAGKHIIRWEHVVFPVSGNYNIEVLADDAVKLYIGNRSGAGAKGIGNGLKDIAIGGDEIIIEKKGPIGVKKFETKFFEAGKYRIRAELTQIPGNALNNGNPMYLALKIGTVPAPTKVQSAKSWNQNPMGIALAIQAPLPPIPQEPLPEQEGTCPRIPFWTTRFPNGRENWWPVTFNQKAWSKFTNRYAISPIPPLGINGSDGAGVAYSNEWDIEVEQRGYYGLKGTVDNGGVIYIDGKEIISGGVGYKKSEPIQLYGFNVNKPKVKKVLLEPGIHKIKVEVKNAPQFDRQVVHKEIFHTSNWVTKPSKSQTVTTQVEFDVFAQGNKKNTDMKFVFQEIGGDDSFIIKNADRNSVKSVKRVVKKNTDYKVTAIAGGSIDTNKGFPITYDGLNSANDNINVTDNRKTIKLKDGDGSDANAEFKIMSSSPNVTAKFSDDGKDLEVEGNGDVTIRLKWNDNPNTAGVAVKSISLGGKTWKQSGTKGEQTETIKTNKSNSTSSLVPEQGTLKKGTFGQRGMKKESSNKSEVIFGDIIGSYNDNDDMQIKCNTGIFTPSNKRSKTATGNKGTETRNTYDLTFRVGDGADVATQITELNGVNYTGPLLATYLKDEDRRPALSPFFDEGLDEKEEIQGRVWNMKWTNVDFPFDGRYTIRALADDLVNVKIDGVDVATARTRQGFREFNFTTTVGKKSVDIELTNIRIVTTRGLSSFRQNPTYCSVQILFKDTLLVQGDRPWITNPIGISAVLTPPPCRKVVEGDGVVIDVIPSNPGNGYDIPETPSGSGGSYPVVPILTGVIIEDGGINHNCGVDVIEVVPSNGVTLDYRCDSFGKIVEVFVKSVPDDGGSGIGSGIFTTTPEIRMNTSTGINFKARPVIKVTTVPEDLLPPDQVIQVTDLVGLKQTGYSNGKPYYGSVFYKDGIRYAGIYETLGTLVPVYDTLQESIDGEIVTRPSAILRQGTDISSNDPRLNIPGTPENLS